MVKRLDNYNAYSMIRQATIFNILHIMAMWKEMMLEAGFVDNEELLDYEQFCLELAVNLSRPEFRCLIAFEDNKPVGFISGYVTQLNNINRLVGFCDKIFVYPEYRKNNTGDKLIDELREFFKECKVDEEKFITTYDEALKRYYNKKGFTPEQITFSREV